MEPKHLTVLGGYGFVGRAFWYNHCLYDVSSFRNERYNHDVCTQNVINFVSTVDNYNVKTNPYVDLETNCMLLMEYLQKWRSLNPQGVFNFISSWFVYGGDQEREDVTEDAHCDPKGFYSITKRTAEQLLISYCSTYNLKYRILRLGNVVGLGDRKASAKKNATQWMINEMLAGRSVSMYGDGNYYREYIDVNDASDAINLVLTKGETNTIYNIGNGSDYWTFGDILRYCRRKIETDIYPDRVELAPIQIRTQEPKDFHKTVQVKSFTMNCDKLKVLGYTPKLVGEKLWDSLII